MFKKIFLSSLVLTSTSLFAQEQAPVQYATCAACHGANGIAIMDMYPNLAGQNKQYLINSYKAYKKGERNGGNAELMKPMANLLATDADIEAVMEWLSKKKN